MLSWTHSCTFGVIFCSVFSAFVEQKTWLLMSGMNDMHAQISVLFEREHVGCLECALAANIANGESFSCHDANQTCLVHESCLVKTSLSPRTFTKALGWRHYWKSKALSEHSSERIKKKIS